MERRVLTLESRVSGDSIMFGCTWNIIFRIRLMQNCDVLNTWMM